MLKLERSLHWGPFPFEKTGGEVVQHLLLDKMHEKSPMHEFYAIPKNIELLAPEEMPYIQFFTGDGDMPIEKYIPIIMSKYHIPLLLPFHISYDVENVIDPVHDVGAKILMHQTVHFKTDLLFNCKRLNDVDWIVTPTKWAKDALSKYGGVSKTKMSVIPHGVDIKKYYPHDTVTKIFYREKKKIVVLFSGRLSTWKGIHKMIPLFREFTKNYNCVFIIKGQTIQTPESLTLDAIMRILTKQNKNIVYISKWQPQSVIEDLFASADILISPTGSEGFNVPLIEAMACGLPIITTSLLNHIEILGSTGTGIFVKPKEVAGWADEQTKLKVPTVDDLRGALKYLVENPEERKIMGVTGRKRAVEYFDLDKVVLQWFDLMDKLIPENYSIESEIMRRMELAEKGDKNEI